MTIRQQYTLAYRLLRDRDCSPWDFVTFKIVTTDLGIDQPARIAALRSYMCSKWEDQIGESYRNLVKDFAAIRAESACMQEGV